MLALALFISQLLLALLVGFLFLQPLLLRFSRRLFLGLAVSFRLLGGLGLLRLLRQHLIGGHIVHEVVVLLHAVVHHGLGPHHGLRRGHQALGADDLGALHHGGHALFIQEGGQRLAHAQLHDGVLRLEGGIGPEGLRRHADGLQLGGGIGPQGMLHPVGELGQHGIGNIAGALCDEVHAHAAGADQLHRLLDLLQQHGRRVAEQHMGLVKEKHQLGLVHIAGLRQALEQLRQHPQQEAGVQRGILHQLNAVQHVDHAPAVGVGAHPVTDIQGRFAEEQVAALLLQRQQRPEDGRYGLRRDVAVAHHVLDAVLVHIGQHGPQILQVD